MKLLVSMILLVAVALTSGSAFSIDRCNSNKILGEMAFSDCLLGVLVLLQLDIKELTEHGKGNFSYFALGRHVWYHHMYLYKIPHLGK